MSTVRVTANGSAPNCCEVRTVTHEPVNVSVVCGVAVMRRLLCLRER